MLCLRILVAALVYVNTLTAQDVLAGDDWADRLTAEEKRGLTLLFWTGPCRPLQRSQARHGPSPDLHADISQDAR